MADVNNEEKEVQEVTEAPEAQEQVQTEAQAPVYTDEIPRAFGQTKSFEYKDDEGHVLRTYHFQFPGIEQGMKIAQLVDVDPVAYRQAMLKQLVTDPEVRSKGLEWFDTHKGIFDVLGALDTFLGQMLNGVRV